jgi:hypothetical protein
MTVELKRLAAFLLHAGVAVVLLAAAVIVSAAQEMA